MLFLHLNISKPYVILVSDEMKLLRVESKYTNSDNFFSIRWRSLYYCSIKLTELNNLLNSLYLRLQELNKFIRGTRDIVFLLNIDVLTGDLNYLPSLRVLILYYMIVYNDYTNLRSRTAKV